MTLELERIEAAPGGTPVLAGVTLTVAAGETVAVLGPSGSGKTTLLRVVAGLEMPAGGRVRWDGGDVTETPAHRRGFGLMFQDLALFPHLDAAGNVAFGLEAQRLPAEQRRRLVVAALQQVGLADQGHRSVTTLSGGEQQRVALARALAPRPRLLMLDEPLASLDRPLRARLGAELAAIFAHLDIPVLYVTHDQDEAFTIADRVAVLHRGRIEQQGPPEEVWRRPATEFVARFLGFDAVADAEIASGVAHTPWGPIPVEGATPGRRRVVIRPDAVVKDAAGPVLAEVVGAAFQAGSWMVRLRPKAGPELQARLGARPRLGEVTRWRIDPAGVVALEG